MPKRQPRNFSPPARKLQPARPSNTEKNKERLPLAPQVLAFRPLWQEGMRIPTIEVRSPSRRPGLFRKQLGTIDRTAQPGDLVEMIAVDKTPLGFGLFNPRAEMTLRRLTAGTMVPTVEWWTEQLQRAVCFRQEMLGLSQETDAYRLVHGEADGFPGLVVDRLGETIAIEAFTVGMYQRAQAIAEILMPLVGAKSWFLRPGPQTLEHEGFVADCLASENLAEKTVVTEFGTKFQVDFTSGHKTGFFCDQRQNRGDLSHLVANQTILDLCCYTGGFAIQGMRLGHAKSATCVELDQTALELAKRNAKLNRIDARFVQIDAFDFLRQQIQQEQKFDVVVLDPPKLIRERAEMESGKKKYFDLNRLAMQVVNPGGILVTCSCSGLLDAPSFQALVAAAVPEGRQAQMFQRTGAAADHPVALDAPEGEYLAAIWLRVQ